MKVFIIFALLGVTLAGTYYAIFDLIEMVPTWEDKSRLRVLLRDRNTSRSEIQRQINEIVARQSQDIQNAYRILYQDEQTRMQQQQRRRLENLENRGASQNQIAMQQQVFDVMNDMSLSQSEVRNRIHEIYSSQWTTNTF